MQQKVWNIHHADQEREMHLAEVVYAFEIGELDESSYMWDRAANEWAPLAAKLAVERILLEQRAQVFHVAQGERQYGPVSLTEALSGYADGTFDHTAQIWRHGEAEWTPLQHEVLRREKEARVEEEKQAERRRKQEEEIAEAERLKHVAGLAEVARRQKEALIAKALAGQAAKGVSTTGRQLVKMQRSRGVYVILGLFFGALGVHDFYIGRIERGVLWPGSSLIAFYFWTAAARAEPWDRGTWRGVAWLISGVLAVILLAVIFNETKDADGDPLS